MDSERIRYETEPKRIVTIDPPTVQTVKTLLLGFFGWVLVGIFMLAGLMWVLSGDGATSGGRRDMTPGAAESIIVAWVFFLAAGMGFVFVPIFTLWNAFARDSLQITNESVILRRTLWCWHIEQVIPRLSVCDFVAMEADRNKVKTSWHFWDFVVTNPKTTTMAVDTVTTTYGIGRDLNLVEALELQTWLQEVLEEFSEPPIAERSQDVGSTQLKARSGNVRS